MSFFIINKKEYKKYTQIVFYKNAYLIYKIKNHIFYKSKITFHKLFKNTKKFNDKFYLYIGSL